MRGWVYSALIACAGCQLEAADGAAVDGGIALAPDPDFKWVGAFPSYTATEVTGQLPVDMGSRGSMLFAPAAVGSDGSFTTYEFAATNIILEPPESSVVAGADALGDLGLVTSLTYVDGGYVATTDQPETEFFETSVSPTGVSTLATDVEFTEDLYSPIPTALAFDGSQAYVFSASRNGTYAFLTSKALTGSADDIPGMASQLAEAGFVITAFGQLDDVPTFGMVGVNSHYARDAVVTEASPGSGSNASAALFAAGYVPVGGYVSEGATYFVFER